MTYLINHDYSSFSKIFEVYEQSDYQVYRTLGHRDFSVEDAQKAQVANRLGLD
jgi:hypothetical protein